MQNLSNNINQKTIIYSLIWKTLERSIVQIIQFVIQVIIARKLLPDDFGVVAIAMIFISLMNVLVQGGFHTALIQKKDATDVDFTSALLVSLILAGVMYGILFLIAPFAASFYKKELVTQVIQVLGLILFLNAFFSVLNAYVTKHMLFKQLFYSSTIANAVSGIVGVIIAVVYASIWSIVAMQLIYQGLVTLILWMMVSWRPKIYFSVQHIKELIKYSWKLVASAFIDNFYDELAGVIIGRIGSPAALGYYSRGNLLPEFVVVNTNGIIETVLLPTLASKQDNIDDVKSIMRVALLTNTYILFPLMVGLGVVATHLIEVLLTVKWLPSVPFMQIFCAVFALIPLHTMNLQVIKALGHSDIFLKLEVVKKIVGLVILIACFPFGIYMITFGYFINGIIATYINAYPNKRLINYSYLDQVKDILPNLMIACVMGVIVYGLQFAIENSLICLIVQVAVGGITYVGLSHVLQLESYTYLLKTFKTFLNNKTT